MEGEAEIREGSNGGGKGGEWRGEENERAVTAKVESWREGGIQSSRWGK